MREALSDWVAGVAWLTGCGVQYVLKTRRGESVAAARRSMTGSTRDEYAIAYSTSRPLEAILRLGIDTDACLKTFGATKRMGGGIAIGRAIRRRALLVSGNYALRGYRQP